MRKYGGSAGGGKSKVNLTVNKPTANFIEEMKLKATSNET